MSTNNLTANYTKIFGTISKNLPHNAVAMDVAGKIAHNRLKSTRDRYYTEDKFSEGYISDVVLGADNNIQGFTGSQVSIDSRATYVEYSFLLDSIDKERYLNSPEWLVNRAKDARKQIVRKVDGTFFNGASAGAGVTVDMGKFGGSTGTAIDFSPTNVVDVLAGAKAELRALNGGVAEKLCAVVSEKSFGSIESKATTVGFRYADKAINVGMKGSMLDLDIYVSPYLTHEIDLTMSDVAVADDTLVIGGVTFTAKASPAAAGEFDVEESATDQATTIAAFINNPATTTANFVAITDKASLAALNGYTATSSAGVVTITHKYGEASISAAGLTNGAVGTQRSHNVVMEKGAYELCMPNGIISEERLEPRQRRSNFITEGYFGTGFLGFNNQKVAKLVTLAQNKTIS